MVGRGRYERTLALSRHLEEGLKRLSSFSRTQDQWARDLRGTPSGKGVKKRCVTILSYFFTFPIVVRTHTFFIILSYKAIPPICFSAPSDARLSFSNVKRVG